MLVASITGSSPAGSATGRLRRLRADVRRRRLPGRERGRDGLRRCRRGGRVRGTGCDALRRSPVTRASLRTWRSRLPERSATSLGSLVGWAIGDYGGRPLLEKHGRLFHLDGGQLDKAEPGSSAGATGQCCSVASRRSCARSSPSRPASSGAARALHGADADRVGSVVLRARRASAGASARAGSASTAISGTRTTSSCWSSWQGSPGWRGG